MKNLNKFTKAELISKLNGLKSNKNDSNSGLFTNLMTTLLLFKSFLLKITLIAIIIKIFKKYSIFRRIWTIFNTILFSIFGISLIDFYEIDALSKVFHNILDVFSNFYTNLSELFVKKPNVPIEIPSRLNPINSNSTGDQESAKIFERFSKIINKNEQIQPMEDNEEITPYYKNKYVIIAGILILSGLSWYFWDDLKPIGTSVLAWINASRSRPDPDADSSNGGLQRNNHPNLEPNSKLSLKDRVFKLVYGDKNDNESDSGSIELQSNNSPASTSSALGRERLAFIENRPLPQSFKDKSIDLDNLSASEIDRRFIQPTQTGLKEITSGNFVKESAAVLNEIDTFIHYQETSSFPKMAVQLGLYNLLKERLFKLSRTNNDLYTGLIQDDSIDSKIKKFLNLEKEFLEDPLLSPKYDEVQLATVQEQEVWSDKGNTPSVHSQLLSPLPEEDIKLSDHESWSSSANAHVKTLIDSTVIPEIHPWETGGSTEKEKRDFKQEEMLIEKNKSLDDSSFEHSLKKEDKPIVNEEGSNIKPEGATEEVKTDRIGLFQQIKSKRLEYGSPVETQQIEIKAEEIKPEILIEEVKTERISLFDQIKSLRKGSPNVDSKNITETVDNIQTGEHTVKASPNVGNIGLQTPIAERLNASPLLHKPSISNLFEDTMDLFIDDPVDTGIDTSGESSTTKQEIDNKNVQSAADIKPIGLKQLEIQNTGIFDQIKARRKAIDSEDGELVETKSDESVSNYEPEIDWREEIKVDIQRGKIEDRFININFGENFEKLNKIYIMLNDGSSQYINIDHKNQIQSIKWDNKGSSSPDSKELDIFKIFVMDKISRSKTIEIYDNHQVKILESFHKNKVGRNY